MKRFTGACVLMAALAGASAARAAVSIVVTDLGVPNDGLTVANGSKGDLVGYHAYLVTADAGSGSVINGVDFSVAQQGSADKAIRVPLHQSWFISTGRNGSTAAVTPNDLSTTNRNGDESYDSHIILNPANIVVVDAPTETNDAFTITNSATSTGTRGVGTSPFVADNGNPLVDGGGDAYGTGTLLAGDFGITAGQVQMTPVLYLVIADRQHLTTPLTVATGEFSEGGAVTGVFDAAITLPAVTSAPEPASVGLATLSLGGLLVRRRKAN